MSKPNHILYRFTILLFVITIANCTGYSQSTGVYMPDSSSVFIPSGATAGIWGDTMQVKGKIGMADSTSAIYFQGNVWENRNLGVVKSGKVVMNDTLMQTIIGEGSYSSGGSSFDRIELNNPSGVNLVNSHLRVDSQFIFSQGVLFTNHNDLLLGPGAAVRQGQPTSFAIAGNGGGVSKFYGSNEAFTFPLGCWDSTLLYNPLKLDVVAQAYNPLSYARVTMVDSVHSKKTPRHTEYGEKSWSVRFNNLAIDSANYEATYNNDDQFHGDTAKIGGSSWANNQWTYSGGRINGNGLTVTGTLKSDADIFGQNRALLVNTKAILEGPWNGSGMTTTLRNSNLIPATQPYATAPYNVAGFNYAGTESRATLPANAVDWVLLELRRSPTGPVVDRAAGILLNTGNIIDGYTDGPVEFMAAPDGDYYISIKHRNHVGIMSASAISLPDPSLYDFTTDMSKAYGSSPMATLSNGKLAMHGGNVIPDSKVRASGPGTVNDLNRIDVILVEKNVILSNVYSQADVNLDGKVRATGPAGVNDYNKLITFLGALNLIITQPF